MLPPRAMLASLQFDGTGGKNASMEDVFCVAGDLLADGTTTLSRCMMAMEVRRWRQQQHITFGAS